MCDPSGDIELQKGLLLAVTVRVNASGQIVGPAEDESWDKQRSVQIQNVYECVATSVKSILALVGHERNVVAKYSTGNNMIVCSEQATDYMARFVRMPDVHLVKEDDQLHCVLIDEHNVASIVGMVTSVVPGNQNNLAILNNDRMEMSSTKELGLRGTITCPNSTLVMTSLNGFVVVKPNQASNDLVLILEKGYFVLQNKPLWWKRVDVSGQLCMRLAQDGGKCLHGHGGGESCGIEVENNAMLLSGDHQSSRHCRGGHFPCRTSRVDGCQALLACRSAIILQVDDGVHLVGNNVSLLDSGQFVECLQSLF